MPELRDEEDHMLALSVNTFAKRSDGTINPGRIPRNIDEQEGVMELQPVGMDGMNKNPLMGGAERSVDMDGMNKTPVRGGVGLDGMPAGDVIPNGRKTMKAARKINEPSGLSSNILANGSKLLLGVGAKGSILQSRACPNIQSPKRVTPMEIDPPLSKKKQKRKQVVKNGKEKNPPSQQLLTNMWKSTGDSNRMEQQGEKKMN